MSDLSISNVINISVAETQTGLSEYNTSAIALFTNETPLSSFGSGDYKIYLEPSEVMTDFGSSSVTYKKAAETFSQAPNILQGDGYLAVIPLLPSIQTITFSVAPDSGAFKITSSNGSTASIAWDATLSTIQTALQAVVGQSDWTVAGSIASLQLAISCNGNYGEVDAVTVTDNTLTRNLLVVTATVASTQSGETLSEGITRMKSQVSFFGVEITQTAESIGSVDVLAAAELVQSLKMLLFISAYTESYIQTGGLFRTITSSSYTHTRCIYYGDSSNSGLNAMLAESAYASRLMSVNFDGSNTTITMHLKTLKGVDVDPTATQTILGECTTTGADDYVSIRGIPCVFTSGANTFSDRVYNLLWFVGALEVAGFNYLRQTATKIPQTEKGMDGLKGAYRKVCEQAIRNAFGAPGEWTSSTTFGDQDSMLKNIEEVGYYIYSTPVSEQSQANREDRKSPLVQIALKEAGAVHSSDVIVNINA